jgi:hypothetical protein
MIAPLAIRLCDTSQRKRKRVEELFRWLKTVATLCAKPAIAADRVGWMFIFATAAYNLVRMCSLAVAGLEGFATVA